MQEDSLNIAATQEPHNNNLKKTNDVVESPQAINKPQASTSNKNQKTSGVSFQDLFKQYFQLYKMV